LVSKGMDPSVKLNLNSMGIYRGLIILLERLMMSAINL